MTDFCKAVLGCFSDWDKRSITCGGDVDCLEQSARQLRECLKTAFPDSNKIEFESDKVNYMFSSVFFLINRLTKATQGLAEFDKLMKSVESIAKNEPANKENQNIHTEFHRELDEILAKYF
jgi:hypothetical protein